MIIQFIVYILNITYGTCKYSAYILHTQYAPTMKPLMYMVNVAMASYEQWYNADRGDSMIRQLVTSIFSGGRYIQVSKPSPTVLLYIYMSIDTYCDFKNNHWLLHYKLLYCNNMYVCVVTELVSSWSETGQAHHRHLSLLCQGLLVAPRRRCTQSKLVCVCVCHSVCVCV